MSENKNNPQMKEVEDTIRVPHDRQSSWKGFHHSWVFWLFLILMLAGILYYIVSVDFMFAPREQVKQPTENTRTQ